MLLQLFITEDVSLCFKSYRKNQKHVSLEKTTRKDEDDVQLFSLSIPEGTAAVIPTEGFSLPSAELLITMALCLLLLVLLITNTVLCFHYRRRHGWFSSLQSVKVQRYTYFNLKNKGSSRAVNLIRKILPSDFMWLQFKIPSLVTIVLFTIGMRLKKMKNRSCNFSSVYF